MGFQGPLCDLAFCQVKLCENEGFCLINEPPMVSANQIVIIENNFRQNSFIFL